MLVCNTMIRQVLRRLDDVNAIDEMHEMHEIHEMHERQRVTLYVWLDFG